MGRCGGRRRRGIITIRFFLGDYAAYEKTKQWVGMGGCRMDGMWWVSLHYRSFWELCRLAYVSINGRQWQHKMFATAAIDINGGYGAPGCTERVDKVGRLRAIQTPRL